MNFGGASTSISTRLLLDSHESRPLALLLLEYSVPGELERAAALGPLIMVSAGSMMPVGLNWSVIDTRGLGSAGFGAS